MEKLRLHWNADTGLSTHNLMTAQYCLSKLNREQNPVENVLFVFNGEFALWLGLWEGIMQCYWRPLTIGKFKDTIDWGVEK